MSTTSTYYNFIGSGVPNAAAAAGAAAAAEHGKGPISIKTTAITPQEAVNQIDLHRQSAMSPSSFRTSTSNSSSSLNSQFNSLTPNSTASSASSSFSSSASSTASTASTASTTNLVAPSAGQSTMAKSNASSNNGVTGSNRNNSSNINNASSNTPPRSTVTFNQRDLMRQKSVTPTQSMGYHQLHHSYTLQSLEPKPLKPYKTQSAYIEAMKEDLAEWLNSIYNDLELTPENFFAQLETGAIICRHANNVTQMGRNVMIERATTNSDVASSGSDENESSLTSQHETSANNNQAGAGIGSSPSPENDNEQSLASHDRERGRAAPMGSDRSQFYRRHRHSTTNSSISSLATSCSSASKQRLSLTGSSMTGSPRSDRIIDWFRVKLLTYKNDARPGTFFARDNICQFILWCRSLNIIECLLFETDDLVARKNEKSFILCLLEVARIGFKVGMPTPLIIQLEQEIDREIENDAKLLAEAEAERELERGHQDDSQDYLNDDFEVASNDNNDKTAACASADEGLAEQAERQLELNNNKHEGDEEELSEQRNSVQAKEEKEEACEAADFGPKPQVITNDLLSLHERVVQLLCQCTCPTQFPMVRIGDGKYKVGDKLIIFVRILRRHIMVRVGGGWQELSEFLRQKDPCRTRSQNQNYFNQQQQHPQLSAGFKLASSPQSLLLPQTPTTPATATTMVSLNSTSIPVSRSRLLGSGHHMNKGFRNHGSRHSPNGGRISGSASMSWLSHNS